jgi:DNA mismatch endonuclease (patch repair protein)
MTDVHTREQRSRNMSAIRGKDTKPEMAVRSIVHQLGYRYRLHRRDLPGAPDLVFARLHKVINVHGCFWHMHACRYGLVTPKTNAEFWQTKRKGNVDRDRIALRTLRASGWDVLTVWECETRDAEALERRLRRFLGRLPAAGRKVRARARA